MLLILLFLLVAVVWGFLHANPQGVPGGGLLACNAAVLALALAAALAVGFGLHADAAAVKPDERAFAAYLGIMAGGTTFMIVVAVGGLIRNLLVFPLSRRQR